MLRDGVDWVAIPRHSSPIRGGAKTPAQRFTDVDCNSNMSKRGNKDALYRVPCCIIRDDATVSVVADSLRDGAMYEDARRRQPDWTKNRGADSAVSYLRLCRRGGYRVI